MSLWIERISVRYKGPTGLTLLAQQELKRSAYSVRDRIAFSSRLKIRLVDYPFAYCRKNAESKPGHAAYRDKRKGDRSWNQFVSQYQAPEQFEERLDHICRLTLESLSILGKTPASRGRTLLRACEVGTEPLPTEEKPSESSDDDGAIVDLVSEIVSKLGSLSHQ